MITGMYERIPIHFEPTTVLFAIGTAASLAGATVSGVGAYQQGKYNAAVAEQEAQAIKQAQKANEPIYKEEADALMGEQIAAAAALGMNPGTGSPLSMLVESRRRYLRDKQTREYEADIGVSRAQSQAGLERMRGAAGLTGSLLGGFGDATLNSARYFRK